MSYQGEDTPSNVARSSTGEDPSETEHVDTEEPDVEKELYAASAKRVTDLNEQGLFQCHTDVAESGRERIPGLRNIEEYEDWFTNAEGFAGGFRQRKREGRDIVGKLIEVEDILKDVTTIEGHLKPCRHASILGGAGTGKKTLARRIARDGLRGKYENLKGKLIVLPDFRAFSVDEKLLPSQFLLKDMFPKYEKSEALSKKYQWMMEHPKKVVFIIDSLHSLPFDLQHESQHIGHYQETTVDVLLHNLLAGHLFKESDIISTSREYKVRNLHPSIRPDRCIVLEGLSKEGSRDLIHGFLGQEKGKEMVNYVDTKCPDIWPMLSVPACLAFSVVVFVLSGFIPNSMSGILMKVFLGFLESPFAKKKNLRLVIRKLMRLSFDGILEGRVLFTPEHLKGVGLTLEDVTGIDFMIPQTCGTYLSTKLVRNEGYIFFSHQLEQECLAALHLLTINLEEYETFLKHRINEPRFSIVRILVTGVLLNEEVLQLSRELVEIPDVANKRRILIESLENAMASHWDRDSNERLPELFLALAESGGGTFHLIRSSLRTITLTNVPLSLNEVRAVGISMKQWEFLSSVSLTGSNMNDEKMDTLAGIVTKFFVKVDEFHSSDSDLGTDGIKNLARLVKHLEVKGLEVARCKLDSDRLQVFHSAASGMKLKRLDVSGNPGIKGKGMSLLGKLVIDFGICDLEVAKCNLVLDDLENFSRSSENAMLAKLNISGNEGLSGDGLFLLGEFVSNRGVRDLDASLCNPTPQDLTKLAEGLGEATVDFLNLRNLAKRLPYCRTLLDLMRHVKKLFNLQGWKMNDAECRELQHKLNEMPRTDLEIMIDEDKDMPAYLKAYPYDSTESDVEADGGEIQVGGSKIEFPQDTFSDTTRILASSSLGESSLSEEYLAISRLLHFNFSVRPNASARIKIPIWASTDDPAIMFDVLCRKDGDGQGWRKMTSMPLREIRSRIVEFEAGEFNWFAIAIADASNTLMNSVSFYARGEFSFDRHGNFETRLFVDGQTGQDCGSRMANQTLTLFTNQRFHDGDLIDFKVTCDLKDFPFLWGEKDFVVDRRFLSGSNIYYFKMSLKSPLDTQIDIAVMYNLKQNGRSVVQDSVSVQYSEDFGGVEISRDSSAQSQHRDVDVRSEAASNVIAEQERRPMVPTDVPRRGTIGFIQEKNVGRGGGSVLNHGCKVTFSPGTVEEDTKIETAVITEFPSRLENRVPVAPHFKCGPSMTLNKPVLIEIQLWVVPVKEGMHVEVHRQNGDDSDWEFMKRVPIDRNGKISFHSDHFTVFEILSECASWVWSKLKEPFLKVSLRNLLYINGACQTIACVCCLDHSAVIQEVEKRLNNSGYIPLLPHQEIVRTGREVRVKTECIAPDDLRFLELRQPGEKEVEKVFLPIDIQTKRWIFHYLILQRRNESLADYKGLMRFAYLLTTDTDQVQHPMQTMWPIRDRGPTNVTKVDFYGPVNAGQLL